MKVQVTGCSQGTLWYRLSKGKEFEVIDEYDEYRVIEEGRRTIFIIRKKDAKIIEHDDNI